MSSFSLCLLSHSHVGDFTVLCTSKKRRVGLCWVLQSSQDKSSASTDRKTRQFSLKTGILHWREKKLHKTCLLLAVSLFVLRSVWLSKASESLSRRHQKALFTAVIPARNDAAALNLRLIWPIQTGQFHTVQDFFFLWNTDVTVLQYKSFSLF